MIKKYNKKIPEAENITTKKINNSKFEKEKILLKKLFNKINDEGEKCKSKIIYIDIALYNKESTSKARNYIIDYFNNLFKNSKKINL